MWVHGRQASGTRSRGSGPVGSSVLGDRFNELCDPTFGT